MGVDGTNNLHIRGSKEILDAIEQNGAYLDTTEENVTIAKRFFGKENAQVVHRSEKYLVFHYDFRNEPVYSYLEELLKTYPTCWFKNEYSTEIGACGMWIGRFHGKEINIQKLEWQELCDEEISYETDFSREPYVSTCTE